MTFNTPASLEHLIRLFHPFAFLDACKDPCPSEKNLAILITCSCVLPPVKQLG